jgi:hypothetical protein
MGKDFYDIYYYLYNDNKINAKEIIVISEEISFARNTKISINIANDVVYEFLTKPDEEFLNAVAKEALYATYLYIKNLEKESNYFIQY